MPDHQPGAAGEQWYGAQEAARFLGVHRSTLNIAVRQGLIAPDQLTPGGHARFRRETLAAYRVHLTDSAATSREGVMAPARVLAEVAHLLTAPTKLEQVASAVVEGIRRALPGVDMCCVSVRSGDPADRNRMRLLAQHGFPHWIFTDYSRYRSMFRFATTTALQTLEAQFCEDATRDAVFSGTAHLFRSLRLGAYAVQPIMWNNEALGTIACIYQHAHPFDDAERTFLRGVADELASALQNSDQLQQLTSDLSHAQLLMRHALLLRADPTARVTFDDGNEQPETCGQVMGTLFQHLTGAREVCALGFGKDLPTSNLHLLDLACRACAGDEMAHDEWSENGVLYTGLGASVPLRRRLRAGVAAIWPGSRTALDADHALLVTFAGAYIVATEAC
ncbi:MAG TPA: GAF domain-containing protein [Ktedonobacterales bacterium]|nr:GAF domain-containing protein [Ktedonobacterales bacterium]